jgi:hypothetical protein
MQPIVDQNTKRLTANASDKLVSRQSIKNQRRTVQCVSPFEWRNSGCDFIATEGRLVMFAVVRLLVDGRSRKKKADAFSERPPERPVNWPI